MKVYCKDCQFYKNDYYGDSYSICRAKSNIVVKDSWKHRYTEWAKTPITKNLMNDCPDYKEKVSRWKRFKKVVKLVLGLGKFDRVV